LKVCRDIWHGVDLEDQIAAFFQLVFDFCGLRLVRDASGYGLHSNDRAPLVACLVSGGQRRIDCIAPTMFQIGGLMARDELDNARP
jgi:hypothetical protein